MSPPRRRRKRSSKPPPKGTMRWIVALPVLWKIVIFGLGLPGLYIGILNALPRVSVTPQENIHPNEPLLAPFIISNDGWLDLHSVSFLCNVDYLGTNRDIF